MHRRTTENNLTTTETRTRTKPKLTPAELAEISRRNGAKGKGPRTPEGKERTRFNALKHGMAARTLVLPGEDADMLQFRIDTWTNDLAPRNELESQLIREAAAASWQLDRVNQVNVSRLADIIRSTPAEEAPGRRPRSPPWAAGSCCLMRPANSSTRPTARLDPFDPTSRHPLAITYQLEGTAAGCQFLLDQWAELRAVRDCGVEWNVLHRLRMLRLLGKKPMRSREDPIVETVLPSPYLYEASFLDRNIDIPRPDPTTPETRPVDEDQRREEEEMERQEQAREDAAQAALPGLIERAVARLENLARGHRERAAADSLARLAFDTSADGEKLRRYQVSCHRMLLRTVEAFYKARRENDRLEIRGVRHSRGRVRRRGDAIPLATADGGQPSESVLEPTVVHGLASPDGAGSLLPDAPDFGLLADPATEPATGGTGDELPGSEPTAPDGVAGSNLEQPQQMGIAENADDPVSPDDHLDSRNKPSDEMESAPPGGADLASGSSQELPFA